MGGVCSTWSSTCSACCNPHRSGSFREAKDAAENKPFTEPSPVFPVDGCMSSSYRLHQRGISTTVHGTGGSGTTVLSSTLTKRNSLGTSPYAITATATPSGAIQTQIHGSTSFSDSLLSSTSNKAKSFVSRIPPLGRSGSSEHSCSDAKVQNLFAKYRDASEDAIVMEGIESLCLDLELKPEEFKVLVLAWKCNVVLMCRFSRSEFLTGCRALKADSLRALQARLPEAALQLLNDEELFKDLYRFTFRFGLEPGQKVLPTEMAVSLWQLVFSQKEPPLLSKWISYLQQHKEIRGIPKDTWNMFLNLIEALKGGDDLSIYDDTEAWPSLFDDFVEFENDKANQNVGGKSDLAKKNSFSLLNNNNEEDGGEEEGKK